MMMKRRAEARSDIADVSETSLWVAHYRATETERPDALFGDPLAARLAGERGRAIADSIQGSRYTGWSVIIRTVVIDALIQKLVHAGADTVVNLGAGLDTRPYRLDVPGSLRWFEVDVPHLIEFKEERLRGEAPRCRLERVGFDLSDRGRRSDFLSRVSAGAQKCVVLTEGVIPYLANDQVASLAEDLRSVDRIRFWIAEYFSPQVIRFMSRGKRRQQMRNAPFLFDPGDWFGFFEGRGWRVEEVRYLGEESVKLGRQVPLPWIARILKPFLSPRRRSAFGRINGYMLLVPK
jgi:methyltransferase (TIGR00027 family)